MDYLSNIELYYTPPENCSDNIIKIEGEECNHILKVMRHSTNDIIHVTDGAGHIFKCEINKIFKDHLVLANTKTFNYENNLSNIVFCIPKLKNTERFEFAIEKCTELGITNFIVFESTRTISKGTKIERWNKIILSAMKQSLRSYLPVISTGTSLSEINELPGEKIIFEQKAESIFNNEFIKPLTKYYFIFGPEGGLSEEEIDGFNIKKLFRLADNRLRTETAIVKCASILS